MEAARLNKLRRPTAGHFGRHLGHRVGFCASLKGSSANQRRLIVSRVRTGLASWAPGRPRLAGGGCTRSARLGSSRLARLAGERRPNQAGRRLDRYSRNSAAAAERQIGRLRSAGGRTRVHRSPPMAGWRRPGERRIGPQVGPRWRGSGGPATN